MVEDFDIGRIDLGILSGVFKSTTNSYKFLFFLALLDIAQKAKDYESVSLVDIATGMLHWAWYPHTQHRLSFGTRDQVTNVLDAFKRQSGTELKLHEAKAAIRTFLEGHPEHVKALTDYVPAAGVRCLGASRPRRQLPARHLRQAPSNP